jgi:hypothetical protein
MKAEELIHTMRLKAEEFANAKADRVHIDNFRKSKLAILMKDAERAGYTTAAAQEREALANHEYIELIDGLAQATRIEEKARWDLNIAQLSVEIWRSQQATKRAEINLT